MYLLEKIRVATSDDPLMPLIRKLYTESFPESERREWNDLIKNSNEGRMVLWAFTDRDCFVGFATEWRLPSTRYIEHLAIEPSLRSHGYGSAILSVLKADAPAPIVVEVEPAGSTPEAAQRIIFYSRNGFYALDCDYIQPPYSPGLPEVPLMLMSTDRGADGKETTHQLHSIVYNLQHVTD